MTARTVSHVRAYWRRYLGIAALFAVGALGTYLGSRPEPRHHPPTVPTVPARQSIN